MMSSPAPPSKKGFTAVEFEIWKTWAEESEGHAQQTADQLQDLSLEADVEDLIIAANADKNVHGIMVSMISSQPLDAHLRYSPQFHRSTTPSLADAETHTSSKSSTHAKT